MKRYKSLTGDEMLTSGSLCIECETRLEVRTVLNDGRVILRDYYCGNEKCRRVGLITIVNIKP